MLAAELASVHAPEQTQGGSRAPSGLGAHSLSASISGFSEETRRLQARQQVVLASLRQSRHAFFKQQSRFVSGLADISLSLRDVPLAERAPCAQPCAPLALCPLGENSPPPPPPPPPRLVPQGAWGVPRAL